MEEKSSQFKFKRYLPACLRAASMLLVVLTMVLIVFVPLFNADLGEYMPETEEEKQSLIVDYPQLGESSEDLSISFSLFDIVMAIPAENELSNVTVDEDFFEPTPAGDVEPVIEAPENANNFSRALTILGYHRYFVEIEEWIAGGMREEPPQFSRHANNQYANFCIYAIMWGIVFVGVLICVIFTLVSFIRLCREKQWKKKKRDFYTIMSAVLFVVGFILSPMVFMYMPSVTFTNSIIMIGVVATLAVILEIAYRVSYSRLKPKTALQ